MKFRAVYLCGGVALFSYFIKRSRRNARFDKFYARNIRTMH